MCVHEYIGLYAGPEEGIRPHGSGVTGNLSYQLRSSARAECSLNQ